MNDCCCHGGTQPFVWLQLVADRRLKLSIAAFDPGIPLSERRSFTPPRTVEDLSWRRLTNVPLWS